MLPTEDNEIARWLNKNAPDYVKSYCYGSFQKLSRMKKQMKNYHQSAKRRKRYDQKLQFALSRHQTQHGKEFKISMALNIVCLAVFMIVLAFS